jgi:hypothetical protein
MILRDPAERAFSHYLHLLSVGLTGATFRRHLETCALSGDQQISATYPFLEIGLYHLQVRCFLDLFPRSRIRIYWYEEAWREPAKLLADVFRFLDVDDTFRPDFSRRAHQRRAPRFVDLHYFLKRTGIWYPSKALIPASAISGLRRLAFRSGPTLTMDPADRRYLIDYYRDDIQRLSTLLDRDLTSWLR